jgi:tRNA-2-methylthio-N6-dimethylallyladenosine synthase
MEDAVSEEEKGQRMRRLLEVQREVSTENYKRFVGRTLRVLADGTAKKRTGYLTGKSNEMIIVEFPGDESLIGQFVNVRITGSMNWAVTGEITEG